MRDENTPSISAVLVSYMRAAAPYLPPPADKVFVDATKADERLLAGTTPGAALRLLARLPLRIARSIASYGEMSMHIALRTRAIDDVVVDFVRRGGDQIVILGAGLDVRGVRFAALIAEHSVRVYEVDSPGSQRAKLALIRSSRLRSETLYVAHDFETEPMAELPGKLERAGLNRSRRTLTLLEGVVMYLTASATDATVEATRKLGGPSSQLLVNHVSPEKCEQFAAPWTPFKLRNWSPWGLFMAFVRWRAGERIVSPTHGGVAWGEHAGAYLAEHGWALRWSRSDREFAASIGMPPQVVNRLLPDVFVALAELK